MEAYLCAIVEALHDHLIYLFIFTLFISFIYLLIIPHQVGGGQAVIYFILFYLFILSHLG